MSAVLEAREPSAPYLNAVQPWSVKHFDLLATATGGVKRLRELILTLAVQGKLLPQDLNDEPATELLRKIDAEKSLLVTEGRMQRQRPSPEVQVHEEPFELPRGWAWVRLPQISYDLGQGAPTQAFTYIDVAAIDNERAIVTDAVEVIQPADAPSRARKRVSVGTVIYSTVRPYLKKIAVVEKVYAPSAIVSTAFAVMHPHTGVNAKYLLHYLRSAVFTQFVASKMAGIAYPAINDSSFFGGIVALPPTAEQERIVSRVDELMRLCDALEAKGRLEAEQHARLLGTLLGTLTDSSTPEELATNWQRVADNFDLLLDRPEAVDALEQTILHLAVRGLLVTQDAAEQPAIEALRRLQAQRAKEERETRSRQAASSEAGAAEHAPFGLPAGWVWAKAQELTSPSTIITYGVLKPEWVEVGVPTVRVQDIQEGKLLTDQVAQCLPARAEKFARTKLSEGDLLIAKDGATLGKTAFVPKALEGGNITQHVLRFSIAPSFNREYVRLVIDSPHGQAWMRGETQGVALPGVNVGDFRRMPIPVPPVGEQARIVARVAELRLLCAGLRQRLDCSGATQAALADALIDQALAT